MHTDTPETYPLPPSRETLPTLPCDLTDYARTQTGPGSWSAASDEGLLELSLEDPFADLFSDL